jgi:hypothetical protein
MIDKYFCMIKAELSFDVSLSIDHHNCLFISTLHNLTLHKKCGEIKGDTTKEGKTSVYTVSQSELDENIRGIGLGYKFYIETIKKCFELGCMEFRSSTSLNEMSIGVWESIVKNNYNASFVQRKRDPYYNVRVCDKLVI